MNIDELLREREATHGNIYDVQRFYSTLKELVYEQTIGGDSEYPYIEQVHPVKSEYIMDALLMKLSRAVCGNHKEPDHWKDIAGYATLMYNQLSVSKSYEEKAKDPKTYKMEGLNTDINLTNSGHGITINNPVDDFEEAMMKAGKDPKTGNPPVEAHHG